MKKKKPRKTTKDVDKVREEKPRPETAASNEGDFSERTDYGGLPDRDLKKNLGGCG